MAEENLIYGTIDNIKVGYDICTFQLRDESTNNSEFFILFWNILDLTFPVPEIIGSSSSDTSLATLRVIQSMKLTLLREALVNNLRVCVRHTDTSQFVDTLKVFNSVPTPDGPFGGFKKPVLDDSGELVAER